MIVSKDYKPLVYIKKNIVLAYKKGTIYILDTITNSVCFKCKLPVKIWERIAVHVRVIERIMRLIPRTVEMINEYSFVIAFKGIMYYLDLKKQKMEKELHFPVGMSSPLNISLIQNNRTIPDGLYFGEYSANIKKESVKIWRRSLVENKWEVVYEFEKGLIHHVHNIIPDYKNEFVYILTGDDDEGSGIWKASMNFTQVEPLLLGSQSYRSCVLFDSGRKVIYCTDTPMKQNYICFCSKEKDELKIIKKRRIAGPVIYGASDGRNIILSTTVEPNSVYDGRMRIRTILETKIGDGIEDRYVHVLIGNEQDGFREIYCSKKDIYPMRLCQFGSVQFPKYSYSKYGIMSMAMEATKEDNEWISLEE